MGYLYALLAAVLFGLNGSASKVVMASGLDPVQLTQFRVLGTALLAGGVLLVIDRGAFRISGRQLIRLALLGVFGVALLQATYAVAVQLLPVGIALLLEYMAVLLVAVIAFFFFKEPVRARLWVAIGCVLVGLALVARVWSSELNPLGVVMALAAAVSLTIYFIGGEKQVSTIPPLTVAFWTMTAATVFWGVLSGWWRIEVSTFTAEVSLGGALSAIELPMILVLLWVIVLGSFAPFVLSFLALRHLTATAAGVVASSEVLFAFLFAWLWLGETLDVVQLIGAGVVLAGIVLAQTARAGKVVVDADLALPEPKAATSGR
ncbi:MULTISPECIES: DMT family transporter [unclassified Diaminobutyricimonas]|uniref:DMT family transporter n=1 Tax=unclassified Diaminobutyricimonas TaxID=2643261 RepID=UPI001420189F|nr:MULTISPECIES: DMT family transporter [unclassified Diaminobutyricimonas]